jgi:hypothetical protein
MTIIVTSWSDFHPDLDEMPKRLKWKEQQAWLYRNLRRRKKGRFSCFEIGENMEAAKRLSDMIRRGMIDVTGGDFPWSTYELHPKRIRPRPLRPIRTKTPVYLEML